VKPSVLAAIFFVQAILLCESRPLLAGDGPVAASRPGKAAGKTIATLVSELGHERYAVRQQATVELSKRGVKAIAALTVAARNSDPETAARAVQVLEMIYTDLQADEATVTKAESALDALKSTRRAAVAKLAAQVFSRHDDLREKRAIAAIERLGGIIKYDLDAIGNAPFAPDQSQVGFVVLGSKWKGGDDGLKYIARLPNLNALYVARNKKFTPISLKAQNKLQRELPNLKIEERGLACLGVRGQAGTFNNVGCYIQSVEKNSAAARGGLRASDIITQFAGKRVATFGQLVEQIGEHNPGDNVEVQVLRNGRLKSLKVKLGEWTKTN
jgi:PDZ domain